MVRRRVREDVDRQKVSNGVAQVAGLVFGPVKLGLRVDGPDDDHLQACRPSGVDLARTVRQEPGTAVGLSYGTPGFDGAILSDVAAAR